MDPKFFNFNIVEVGGFVLALGYIYTTWKNGGNQASSQVVQTYKELAELNTTKISELTHEVGVLTGQLKEKDERLKLLESIIQGRDPNLKAYQERMLKFTEGVADYMASSTKTLGEVAVYMRETNSKAAKVV